MDKWTWHHAARQCQANPYRYGMSSICIWATQVELVESLGFFDVFPSFDHPKPEFHLRMVLTQLLLKSFQRRSQQLFAFLNAGATALH